MDELEMLMLLKRAAGGKPLVEYTATGNPLTFNTNKAKPLKSLLIPWTPSQSGSGDPSPENVRPISGVSSLTAWRTGKNIFHIPSASGSYSDVTYSYNAETNTLTKSGIAHNNGGYNLGSFLLPAGSYCFSAKFSSDESGTSVYLRDKAANVNICYVNKGRTSQSFTTSGGEYYFRVASTGTAAGSISEFQIELGSSPSPYTPYVGTSYPVTFPALGKNLFGFTVGATKTSNGIEFKILSDGSVECKGTRDGDKTGWGIESPLYELKAGTYTVSVTGATNARTNVVNDSVTPLSTISTINGNGSNTFTLAADTLIHVYNSIPTGTSIDETVKVQIEKGSSATSYEPYTNTCYGGELDLVSGVLTVEWKNAAIKDLTWVHANAGYFYTNVTDHKQPPGSGGLGLLCSAIPYGGTKGASAFEDGYMYDNAYSKSIYVKDTSCADTDALKTKYGNYSIVYPLDEPIIYSLSDLATITTLIGDNTIWSDTNGSNTAVYLKRG